MELRNRGEVLFDQRKIWLYSRRQIQTHQTTKMDGL